MEQLHLSLNHKLMLYLLVDEGLEVGRPGLYYLVVVQVDGVVYVSVTQGGTLNSTMTLISDTFTVALHK